MKYFDFAHIQFAHPQFFLLLIAIPVFIYFYWKRKNTNPALKISSTKGLENLPQSLKVKTRPLLFVLRLLAFTFLTIALARPQSSHINEP